ncbi:MAG TPA: hypothetical protein DCW90_18495 [Lachnospiraceae bacterium]|nr:hypothetical protein [Lachnospiraceae bacterium]
MSINEIMIVVFMIISFFSKIFILGIEFNFKHKLLENLAVAAFSCDFIVIFVICDYIFKWGCFF